MATLIAGLAAPDIRTAKRLVVKIGSSLLVDAAGSAPAGHAASDTAGNRVVLGSEGNRGFVDFDQARQGVALGLDHRPADAAGGQGSAAGSVRIPAWLAVTATETGPAWVALNGGPGNGNTAPAKPTTPGGAALTGLMGLSGWWRRGRG